MRSNFPTGIARGKIGTVDTPNLFLIPCCLDPRYHIQAPINSRKNKLPNTTPNIVVIMQSSHVLTRRSGGDANFR